MKGLIDWIETHPTTIASVIVPTMALFFPQVRSALPKLWRWLRNERMKQEEFRKTVLDKLGYIESEMRFNGGNSIRDIVWQLRNQHRANLWRALRPSLEIGLSAKIDAVSETACHLFGVSDTALILDRNWFNCVDGGLDDFLRAYDEAISFGSSTLVFPLALKTYEGKPRGKWEMRLNLITQKGAKAPKFTGYFRAIDDIAKAASDELQ